MALTDHLGPSGKDVFACGSPARLRPEVSFVVPCYNYGQYVAQAVDSVLAQRNALVEVIVVDDASTDQTAEVLQAYRQDPRVSVIHHAVNQGHIYSYNEGLAMTQGRFVGLLSADDYVASRDAVARQVAAFDRNPSIGLVYAAHLVVDGSGRTMAANTRAAEDYVRGGLDEFRSLIWENYVSHSGTLVRRTCHDDLGWYDPRLPHAGDWDMWLRLCTRYDVAYIAEPLFAYRIHQTNMSHARVTPGAALDEILLTLDRNFSILPPDATTIRADWRPARRHALLLPVWLDLAYGRPRRSWLGLFAAIRRAPGILLRKSCYAALARIAWLAAVGPERYSRRFGGLTAGRSTNMTPRQDAV